MNNQFNAIDRRFYQINEMSFKLSNQMTEMQSFTIMQSNNHEMNEHALVSCFTGGNIKKNICRMNDDALVSSAVD